MENFKKKCMKGRIGSLIVFVTIAVVLLVITKFAAFRALSVTKLSSDSDFDKLKGKYVSYEMKMPLDYYETIGSVSDSGRETIEQYAYFVYDVDGDFFFGVARDKKLHADTENMIDNLWAYWNKEVDAAPKSVTIKGTLTAMDSDDKKFFKQAVDYYADYDITADSKYYYIEEGRVDGERVSTANVCTVIAIILIAAGLAYYFYGNVTWDKNLKKLSAKTGIPISAIEADFNSGKVLNGGRTVIGRRWLFAAESVVKICEIEDYCWGYYYKRTGRYSVSQMRLFAVNKGMFTVNASEPNTKEMLEYMYDTFPFFVIGYNKELEKMYNKDRHSFLNIRYNEWKNNKDNC